MKKNIGIILIVLGLIAGAYGLIVVQKENTLIEVGDIQLTDDLEISDNNPAAINSATIGGVILLVAGVLTLVVKK